MLLFAGATDLHDVFSQAEQANFCRTRNFRTVPKGSVQHAETKVGTSEANQARASAKYI